MQELSYHPEIKTITAFGLGSLSDAESMELDEHLAYCEECCKKLAEVPDDALVSLLKASMSGTCVDLPAAGGDTIVTSTAEKSEEGNCRVPTALQRHPRYLVLESLGSGGMGTVYKARHRLMERQVALKVINPLLVSRPDAVDRFTREIKAAAQLDHPHIVAAYDAESIDNVQLLVMEFVDGQTLAQVVANQGALPTSQACEYLRQAATGLQHALDRGMVHRDIKPHNLMLKSDGDIKILDFGLSRFLSEQANSDGITAFGMLMGSPDYMAPEQLQDAHAADTRADIYGLGCTLYHLLAGQVPFPQTSLLAKLEAHRDERAIPLNRVCPAVPVELAKLVEKMMAKDSAQRFQTPAAVAEALRPYTFREGGLHWPPAKSAAKNGKSEIRGSHPSPHTVRRLLLLIAASSLLVALAYGLVAIVGRDESVLGSLTTPRNHSELQVSTQLEPSFVSEDKQPDNVIEADALSAVDRRAAEFALSIGGRVRVNDDPRYISASDDLPREHFRLVEIVFISNQLLSDEGLANFKDCVYLKSIVLGGTNTSDEGMPYFRRCKNLTSIALDGTRVTDAGLVNFQDCKNLSALVLENTRISDTGLASFKDSKSLQILRLSGCANVTDMGLDLFKDCKSIYWLWLGDMNIGDAGLAAFQGCKNIHYLDLYRTQVTDAGLACFAGCKNLRKLNLEGTQVSDIGLVHFQGLNALEGLLLSHTRVTDTGLAYFTECKELALLELAGTRVSNISLAQIKKCKNLSKLTLQETLVTTTGIAELKKTLPQLSIE